MLCLLQWVVGSAASTQPAHASPTGLPLPLPLQWHVDMSAEAHTQKAGGGVCVMMMMGVIMTLMTSVCARACGAVAALVSMICTLASRATKLRCHYDASKRQLQRLQVYF